MDTTTETTAFLLKDIPRALWVDVKSRADLERRTLKSVLLLLLARYVKRGLPD